MYPVTADEKQFRIFNSGILSLAITALVMFLILKSTNEKIKCFVLPAEKNELAMITPKLFSGRFVWSEELKRNRLVHKLVPVEAQEKVQGPISFSKEDGFIFMHLIEVAISNFGKEKKFDRVVLNLIAFTAQYSFECGFDGFLQFKSKSKLRIHYATTYGAKYLFGDFMYFDTEASKKIVDLAYEE